MKTPAARSSMPFSPLSGSVCTPGDKSISHRALIFGALAEGTSQISGLLEGDDILHTAEAMRNFGARVTRLEAGKWQVDGCGASGWQSPGSPVDFGNAGTGARLVMGAAAGFDIRADYQGDASLSARPMGRVLDPLSEMGARFVSTNGRLPVRQIQGGSLKPISYKPPHASAQVKSAILLAGLHTEGQTEIYEQKLTRDHTENMLEAFGCAVGRERVGAGQRVWIDGPVALRATEVVVPGDPSSAAFLIAAALVVPGSEIIVENVMMNPTRTGLFEVLQNMGAQLALKNQRRSGGERIADIRVCHTPLHGIDVPADRVPSMVDEYPILAVIAATASGTTTLNGLAELRVKESDRLQGTYELLTVNGVRCNIDGDNLIIEGGTVQGGACVATHHDHRLAMSALILGLAAQNPVMIDDRTMIATSFPDYFTLMADIGAHMEQL